MSIKRYDIDAIEDSYYENGFYQSDGPIIRVAIDPEGEWVSYEDFNTLKQDIIIFLNHLETVLDDRNFESIDVTLWNKFLKY